MRVYTNAKVCMNVFKYLLQIFKKKLNINDWINECAMYIYISISIFSSEHSFTLFAAISAKYSISVQQTF